MIQYFPLSENNDYSLKDITKFNNLCFPFRGDHSAYDNYRFVKNPFADKNKDFIYSVISEDIYVAQMLTLPAPLSLNGKMIPAFWGEDYFVLEKCRGEGIGKKLSDYYLKKDFYIAVGFSEKSAIIHQKMGAKIIGYLDFYQKWASPFHQAKFLMVRSLKSKAKKTGDYIFPEVIGYFTRVFTAAELNIKTTNWNNDVIETLRDKTYLEWRFFYQPDRYFMYQSEKGNGENPTYFVAKPYFYKGVNWLRIVDYRFNNSKPENFKNILKAVERLRKKLNLYGVLISSSQEISKTILEEKKFKRKKHEVVLTTFPFQHSEQDEKHNQFIISFADSDMDMHTNLGKFNYGEDY